MEGFWSDDIDEGNVFDILSIWMLYLFEFLLDSLWIKTQYKWNQIQPKNHSAN